MTLSELISEINETHPNQYNKETLTRWITECEHANVDQVLSHCEGFDEEFDKYDYDTDAEKEMLLPDAHAGVYIHYVAAQIDYSNREYGGFSNSSAMYAAAFDDFAANYKRAYRQKKKPMMKHL